MIAVKVNFKSKFKITAETPELNLEVGDDTNLDTLMKICLGKNTKIEQKIVLNGKDRYNAIFVCNNRLCDQYYLLKDGDEISVYPGSSGG